MTKMLENPAETNNDNQMCKIENQETKYKIRTILKNLTGYETDCFTSFNSFTKWLHRPVDGAALGVFRMLFGAAMMIDIAEERGGGQMDIRFGEPQHCHFPLIDGMRAPSFPIMGIFYLCMWLGAIGIMLGYRYRLSCLAFIIPYWYIFLLDKPTWNNHSYLFGLCGSILLFTRANYFWSLDRILNPALPSSVPYWNYFLIKFQFFILYMYAGLKKLTAEWLSGYAMSSLSRHWLFTPFRSVLSAEMTDLLIVHWFTAIFDFFIAFLMTWEKTRLLVTPLMLSFHLMNTRLFIIGMFPWVCLAEVPLFFGFDWPRKIFFKRSISSSPNCCKTKTTPLNSQNLAEKANAEEEEEEDESKTSQELCSNKIKSRKDTSDQLHVSEPTNFCAKVRTLLILIYCCLQLFLPYSHFITKGYNNWTNGLYGYSWDMMVHSYDTVLTSIKIVDNTNDNVLYLDPYAFTEYDRWTKYADMALQYAKCIESNVLTDYAKDPKSSPLSSTNFSIYFDIWCSMNGRFQQRVFDPRVDLLQASWSPFERTKWSLPLLNELNHMRPKLKNIADEVLAWNNYSDVIFVADFPGLTLDNFISADLTNVSLTILEGNVRYKSDVEDEAYFLTAGKSLSLKSGLMHHVTTIGLKPSCYLYTYVNKTMLETNLNIDDTAEELKPRLPLWKEFQNRIDNYKKFLTHIGNCLLFILYGVPIPIELRHRD